MGIEPIHCTTPVGCCSPGKGPGDTFLIIDSRTGHQEKKDWLLPVFLFCFSVEVESEMFLFGIHFQICP
jgi:hypothetical protein